jgi:integrase
MVSTIRDLRTFFFWLAREPGFKSHIAYGDADYFNMSDKDVAVARARREKRVPTLAQVQHVLSIMPADTVLERRDRALIAFTALTVARVGALASFRLRHVDLAKGAVDHDAQTVRSKFGRMNAVMAARPSFPKLLPDNSPVLGERKRTSANG